MKTKVERLERDFEDYKDHTQSRLDEFITAELFEAKVDHLKETLQEVKVSLKEILSRLGKRGSEIETL